jgi:hypothetical protein
LPSALCHGCQRDWLARHATLSGTFAPVARLRAYCC